MKVICAWCKEHIGEKEPLEDNRITHGCCEKCAEKMREELKQFKNTNGRWK